MDEMVPPKRCSHGGSQGSPGGAGRGESQDPNSGTFRIGTWPGPRIWNPKAYVLMHPAGPCTPVLISADCRWGAGERGGSSVPRRQAGHAQAQCPLGVWGEGLPPQQARVTDPTRASLQQALGAAARPRPAPGPPPLVPCHRPTNAGRATSLPNTASRLNRKTGPGRHSAQPRPPGPEGPRKGLGRRARARL